MSPTTIVLGLNGGTLTLTASSGPVNWSIAESASLVGRVTVSPTSGTLASGQSATVTVSAGNLLGSLRAAALAGGAGAGGGGGGACVAGTLTVNPGNITVVLDVSVSTCSSPPPSTLPPSSPPPSSPPPSSPPPDEARTGRLGD